MTEALSRQQAHLWYLRPEAAADPELLRSCEALLADDEREQWRRFHFEADRHLHLVARALVRTTLSRYCDVPPEAWVFARNSHGRPEVVGPTGAPPLRFNLSHARGLVACIVTLDREVGADVERTKRAGNLLEIADRFFAPAEAEALRRLPEVEQRLRFFEYWTLKESYIKARGMGLSLPLRDFAFRMGGNEIRVWFGPAIDDDPEAWQFSLFRPGDRHILAASVRRGGDPTLAIVTRETLPLAP